MKKIKKLIEDYRQNGEAEAEFTIKYWQIGIVLALIILIIITFKK